MNVNPKNSMDRLDNNKTRFGWNVCQSVGKELYFRDSLSLNWTSIAMTDRTHCTDCSTIVDNWTKNAWNQCWRSVRTLLMSICGQQSRAKCFQWSANTVNTLGLCVISRISAAMRRLLPSSETTETNSKNWISASMTKTSIVFCDSVRIWRKSGFPTSMF